MAGAPMCGISTSTGSIASMSNSILLKALPVKVKVKVRTSVTVSVLVLFIEPLLLLQVAHTYCAVIVHIVFKFCVHIMYIYCVHRTYGIQCNMLCRYYIHIV